MRVMTTIAVVGLASGAAAQALSGSLETSTPYGNFVRQGTQLVFKSWPANKTFGAGQDETIGAHEVSAAADTIIGWRLHQGPVLTAGVSEQGFANGGSGRPPITAGSTSSTSSSNVRQEPHAVLLTIRATAGTRGRLESWVSGLALAGSSVVHELDVGNDRTIDLRVVATPAGTFASREWIVTIPRDGRLPIAMITDVKAAVASTHTLWKTGFSVKFTPGPFCVFTDYGSSCGPRLTGQERIVGARREVTLAVTHAAALAPGVLAVGTQRLSLRIPGTSCFVLTNPLLVLPFGTDAHGNGAVTAGIPASFHFAANLQAFVLATSQGVIRITSSQGLEVDC